MTRKLAVSTVAAACLLLLVFNVWAAKTYYFICNTNHGLSGLTGPSRTTYADAQKDANEHVKFNPGHNTSIITNQ